MVIYGIAGRPNARLGCGKSTLLTWLALTHQAKFGQKIVANYHIKSPNFQYLNNPRELLNLYDCFIGLDDVYRYLGFENMRAKKLGRLMAGEIRHHQNNMAIVSSRLKEYIPKSLRDHVQYWCFPLITKEGWLIIDVLNAEGDQVNNILPRALTPQVVKRVWRYYNHREDVQISEYF